jgi:hypothetical protein
VKWCQSDRNCYLRRKNDGTATREEMRSQPAIDGLRLL